MDTTLRAVSLLVGALLGCATVLTAGAQDIEGSRDHPLISRYPGSTITFYSVKAYDEYELNIAPTESAMQFEKTQHLEGKVTMIAYALPEGRSSLEVYRNYEGALTRAGFTPLFACSGNAGPRSCGYLSSVITSSHERGRDDEHQRYLAAKLARAAGDVLVALYVDNQSALLDVVEVKPMESGLVAVNAAALAEDIKRTGHASVYGIFFDTGKWDVKPESEAAIQQVALLLQQDPALKLYVVGHTDNVGDFVLNLDLSRKRAGAVVQMLTTKHGVAAGRLRGDGVGPLAPVASNESEEGRAKNRRVELVRQ
jgi:OmpA-OmpF porin, OOP family